METHADQSSFWFMLSCSDPLQLISQQQIARVQKLAKPELEREMSEDGLEDFEPVLLHADRSIHRTSLLSQEQRAQKVAGSQSRDFCLLAPSFPLCCLTKARWITILSIGVQGRHAWRPLMNGLAASSFEAKHVEPNCFFLLTSHRLPCWQRTEGCSQCSCHT